MIRVKANSDMQGCTELDFISGRYYQSVRFTPLMDKHAVAARLRLLANNIERDDEFK